MKDKIKMVIALISTPISAALMLILVRYGDKFMYIYHNEPGFPKEFMILHVMAFALIAPLLMVEFWGCRFAYQLKPIIRYAVVAEKILVIVLLFIAIPMLSINSGGKEMWALLVGYEFICALILALGIKWHDKSPNLKTT